MNILVLGANGQVGTELLRVPRPQSVAVVGTLRDEVDFTKPETIVAAIARHHPDVVINATAYTAVDKAETERDLAYAVNATAVGVLAETCAASHIPLLHISTDYVFDGQGVRAYRETDPTGPLGVYGASKAAGEAAIRAAQPRHIILRTSWVYSQHGNNFVKTMQRFGRERDEMRIVADQTGTPTSAAEIAEALLTIAAQQHSGGGEQRWGTYHVTARGETTWYGFAEAVFSDLAAREGRRPHAIPIATAEYPTPARRPANSRLDCSKFDAVFKIERRAWESRLADVLAGLATGRAR